MNIENIEIKMTTWGEGSPKQVVKANAFLAKDEWRLWWKIGNKIVKRMPLPPRDGKAASVETAMAYLVYYRPE